MENKDIDVFKEMIKDMKHMLGLDNIKPNIDSYLAYRNYAGFSQKSPIYEKMVELGFAKVVYKKMFSEYIYFLTPSGINYLEDIIGFKIKFDQ